MKGPVIVCGASFMAPALHKDFNGTHFSELIAKRLDAELIVFSTGGCSNFAIGLQVEKAIAWKPTPSLILVGNTEPDRIEIPFEPSVSDSKSRINVDTMMYHLSIYKSYQRTSAPKFMSTCLKDFFQPDTINYLKETWPEIDSKIEPIQNYLLHLYDFKLKKKLDSFVVYSYYHKLHLSGIPYFICTEADSMRIVREGQCPWLYSKDKFFDIHHCSDEIDKIMKENPQINSPYHTTIEAQIKIADILLARYYELINCR